MTFLAGLQAIPKELYEAAEIDGASVLQQFVFVTIPRLKTIFLTVVMLSTIWTATNLQFVFILTRGWSREPDGDLPAPRVHDRARRASARDGGGGDTRLLPVPRRLIVLLTRRMLRQADE